MRTSLSCLLSLLLALASVEFAVARGMAPPDRAVTLCRGLIVETVVIDADGNPVRGSQLCPDVSAALFADAGLPEQTLQRRESWRAVVFDWQTEEAERLAVASPRARGPPELPLI